jgi:periplasmic protein TonB
MSFVDPVSKKKRIYLGTTFVLGLHALLVWILFIGLTIKSTSATLNEVQATIIEELKSPHRSVEPPKPIKKVFVPKPEVEPPIVREPTVQATSIPSPPVAIAQAPAGAAPTQAPAPEVVNAKLDVSVGCQKPIYPDASRNAEEEGAVTVGFFVDVDGKVKDSRIEKSSGFKRLDEAARQALSLCSFKAGNENGKAVASWAKIKYIWRLN